MLYIFDVKYPFNLTYDELVKIGCKTRIAKSKKVQVLGTLN